MEFMRIVAFATLAAIAYGILHDLVTAHVCVEYFTVAHPPVFPTESPLLLAIGWGIIATWWVGLPLGLLLACAARIGNLPKLGLAGIRRSVVWLMLTSGAVALVAGLLGAGLTLAGVIALPEIWADTIAPGKWPAFAFDLWAHTASYAMGACGGILVVALTIRRRLRQA